MRMLCCESDCSIAHCLLLALFPCAQGPVSMEHLPMGNSATALVSGGTRGRHDQGLQLHASDARLDATRSLEPVPGHTTWNLRAPTKRAVPCPQDLRLLLRIPRQHQSTLHHGHPYRRQVGRRPRGGQPWQKCSGILVCQGCARRLRSCSRTPPMRLPHSTRSRTLPRLTSAVWRSSWLRPRCLV